MCDAALAGAFLRVLLLVSIPTIALAQDRGPGRDAAVGTDEERLASSIEFESSGALLPAQGLTAQVRMAWGGTAGFMARAVYGRISNDALSRVAESEADRSGFVNFVVSDFTVNRAADQQLPVSINYSIRQPMYFGVGGHSWHFYVPLPRVFTRLRPFRLDEIPNGAALQANETLKKVMTATTPNGMVPVGNVGRWTVRACYEVPPGAFAIAPQGQQFDTDFATYSSKYSFDKTQIVAERTIVLKLLNVPDAREGDLDVFFKKVAADGLQSFEILAVAPVARTEADTLNDEGLAALDRQDVAEAIEKFKRAAAQDPRHPWAAYNLGAAYLGRGQTAGAIAAFEPLLAASPRNAYVRLALAQSYGVARRSEDAQRLFEEQLELTPWSVWSLAGLANVYEQREQFAQTAQMLERVTAMAPRFESAFVRLGTLYLKMQHTDAAVNTFRRGLRQSNNAIGFNNAAWELASRGLALDVAHELIDAGIDRATEIVVTPGMPRRAAIEMTTYLGPMWDTAGWVQFKTKELDRALRWLEAAMWLTPAGSIGEHLGDVLMSLNRREEAARAYAQALECREPSPDAAGKLESIAPGRGAELRAEAVKLLAAARSVSLPAPDGKLEGELLITHDRSGRVVDVEAVATKQVSPALIASVRNVTLPVTMPPDTRDYRVTRRATVSCPHGTGGCVISLWHPRDVPLTDAAPRPGDFSPPTGIPQ